MRIKVAETTSLLQDSVSAFYTKELFVQAPGIHLLIQARQEFPAPDLQPEYQGIIYSADNELQHGITLRNWSTAEEKIIVIVKKRNTA